MALCCRPMVLAPRNGAENLTVVADIVLSGEPPPGGFGPPTFYSAAYPSKAVMISGEQPRTAQCLLWPLRPAGLADSLCGRQRFHGPAGQRQRGAAHRGARPAAGGQLMRLLRLALRAERHPDRHGRQRHGRCACPPRTVTAWPEWNRQIANNGGACGAQE